MKIQNILVIDDETLTLKMTKKALEHNGFNVAIFSRPLNSLKYFQENYQVIDLVITDKNMPEISGQQILTEFKKFCKQTPIFVLTGFSDPEEDKLMIEAGVTKILQKPLSIRDLIAEINELKG